MSLKKRRMYGEARFKTLSDIVKIDTVENADHAAKELLAHFNKLQVRAAKVRAKRAAVLAANRAMVVAKNTKNPKMRSDKLKIAKMYREIAEKMKLD